MTKFINSGKVESIFHLCISPLGCYLIFLYSRISVPSIHSSQLNIVASVMYTMVTPMLNLFIYSLWNKDIKRALGRFIEVASLKRPTCLWLKKWAWLQDSENQSQKSLFFDQIVGVDYVFFYYFLIFSFLGLQLLFRFKKLNLSFLL